jgi:8-oxo-dGTP pyrophosphatase MutT (NUDIX family)
MNFTHLPELWHMIPNGTSASIASQWVSRALTEAPATIQDERFKAIPGRRPSREESELLGRTTRFASVLLTLYPRPVDGCWCLALMQRTQHEGVHSGQVSIPGGEVEAQDLDRLHTAIREFTEELGFPVDRDDILGKLSTIFIPPSGFEVEAYVAVLEAKPHWIPDSREVAAVLELELNPPPALVTRKVRVGAGTMEVPAYLCEGCIVWGATAILLTELFAVLEWAGRTA